MDPTGIFDINAMTGELLLGKDSILDYEMQTHYAVIIEAKESGNNMSDKSNRIEKIEIKK